MTSLIYPVHQLSPSLRILNDCRIECDLSSTLSSDDDYDHDETTPTNNEICLSEDQYMRMLRIHKKKRRMKQV